MKNKAAIVIGAGPAGLTAAFELLTRTGIVPIVLESSEYMGGISRTARYKGNRMDLGGHRFFSKSDRVVQWWLNVLPLEAAAEGPQRITYQNKTRTIAGSPACSIVDELDPDSTDRVMLIRNRLSRIYFLRKFFNYPISFSIDTLSKLGIAKTARIAISYMRAAVFPIRPECSLEDFFINRFGRELYQTFFKSYTEKVWGTPCSEISAEWGKQRIKGLSVWKAIAHVIGRKSSRRDPANVAQKGTETSLIEKFMYPKYGPGQMWEEVAQQVIARGGQILTNHRVDCIEHDGDSVIAVCATRLDTGEKCRFEGHYVLSTMPVKELIASLVPAAPAEVRQIGDGLVYRDFITVGILCKQLQIRDAAQQAVRDNWIYIQEPDVLVGRLQVFNNWSPYLVADPSTTWIGLEYFCNESDALWKKTDAEIAALAVQELESMNIVARQDVLDSTVIRVPKAYPAYFGTYGRFEEIIRYVDGFENLFLMGRNGMHKYNNQDHSMLSAMVVVDNIAQGITGKENIWSVNTEQDYQES